MKSAFWIAVSILIAVVAYLVWNFATENPVTAAVVVIILASLVLNGFYKIPPNCYAERRLWGWRVPGVVDKWTFWIPEKLGGKVKTFSVIADKVSGEVSFVAGNNLKITVPYYMEFRADEKLLDDKHRVIFLGRESNLPTEVDVKAEIEAKLGALGGIRSSDDFKKHLKRIEDYVRASLQMSTPRHTRHNPATCAVCAALSADKRFPEIVIPDTKILEFYESHWEQVRADVKDSANHPNDHSPLEERCGIDILIFRLMNPKYTKETEDSLEKKGQELARADGGAIQRTEAAEWIKLGLTPDEAADAAQVNLLGTPKKIVAVRGGGQAIVVEGGFPGFGGGGGGKGSKGDKGGKGGRS